MKGWFDAFRNDGGPTLYSYSNRTPVTGDVDLITTFVLFGSIYIAFLLIFPGIRKEKLATFLTVTLVLFVGLTIVVAMLGSAWHTSTTTIISSYSVFSKQKMIAEIGGYVGLMHINITYRVLPGSLITGDIEYNERFYWRTPVEMSEYLKNALHRGTPFPIISLAEYFCLQREGFLWGRKYREAGYYASVMLWSSFASWLTTNLLLIMVPRYGAYSMIFTGLCMLITNVIYWLLLPYQQLTAHVEGAMLIFNFGWNYWMVLIAGAGCLVGGLIITTIDMSFPHSFSTILEVDYDTPYDRHVIIEESSDKRGIHFCKARSIENSISQQFIRQVSSKLAIENKDDRQGIVNEGCHCTSVEEDKTTWSYPLRVTP